jgi:hypothetical protein
MAAVKDEKYWFRKRNGLFSQDMGYGWIPITWQGYLMVLLFICLAACSAIYFDLAHADLSSGVSFLLSIIILMLVFCSIARMKTEKSSFF